MKKHLLLLVNCVIFSALSLPVFAQQSQQVQQVQQSQQVQQTGTAAQKDYESYPYWVDLMQDPNANFFETQKAFEAYWNNHEITRGNGWKAFKRWEYWMSRKVTPDGQKPPVQRNYTAMQDAANLTARVVSNAQWTPVGPFTVPSGYNGYRGLGRVNAVAFHPTDPAVIYAGAPAGGLWVSTDDGATWNTTTDIMPTLGVSAIAVDYTNPLVIYLGTGDRDHGDAPGMGVWKSTDGGNTFIPANANMEWVTVSRLLMHPTNPSMLLAATNEGMFRTENGGLTWTLVYTENFKDVVFKPNDPQTVYASASGNFYRSVNNGMSFTQVSTGLPGGYRGAIGVSAANPEVVYFWLTNSDSFKGLYRSTDSGLTFSVRSTSPNIMSWDCNGGSGGQAWYDLDIAVDPNNADILYGGGVNCFKSTNGGQSWAINSHWYGGCGVPSVHADLHVLEYNPLNGRLYAGNDGGVYWTSNGGSSWTEVSNGLVISQAYKLGQSATSRDYVINGYQDNGTSTFYGTEWVNVNGGDGMECAYDPADASYSYSTLYYGPIYRHFNNGDGYQIAGEGSNGINESGDWVTPFTIDPSDGNIMYIGYDNIWRSTNIKAPNSGSVNWTKISNINGDNFNQIALSDADPNILYASDDHKLYRTDNARAASVTWTNLTAGLPTSNYITAIETYPYNANIVYLVQQNRVFKSSDKGATWNEITGDLPDVQMHTLRHYHNSSEGLYLGTDIGVFYRDSLSTGWAAYNTGMPAGAWVTELEIFYDEGNPELDALRAATFGRGMWESPLMQSTLPASAGPISGPASVCAGTSQVLYTVDPIAGAETYVWTLPVGASGSSSSNQILVDFASDAEDGEISVYGVNPAGNGIASSLQITISYLPEQPGAITGADVVCQGATAVEYTVPEVPGAISYIWIMPEGATINTVSANTVLIDFGLTAQSGEISVAAINDCGTGPYSNFEVTVNTKPETPVISASGKYLQSSAPEGNQWYDQQGEIAGATAQDYTVTWDGEYYTLVTLSGCVSDTSNKLTVIVSGKTELTEAQPFIHYPNPFSDQLVFEVNKSTENLQYTIVNSMGKIMSRGSVNSYNAINTAGYPAGVYYLRITERDGEKNGNGNGESKAEAEVSIFSAKIIKM